MSVCVISEIVCTTTRHTRDKKNANSDRCQLKKGNPVAAFSDRDRICHACTDSVTIDCGVDRQFAIATDANGLAAVEFIHLREQNSKAPSTKCFGPRLLIFSATMHCLSKCMGVDVVNMMITFRKTIDISQARTHAHTHSNAQKITFRLEAK